MTKTKEELNGEKSPDALKTLKDLGTKNIDGIGLYFETELKAEAVKWVKEINCGGEFPDFYEAGDNLTPVIEWIKHFFNLTDEDLK